MASVKIVDNHRKKKISSKFMYILLLIPMVILSFKKIGFVLHRSLHWIQEKPKTLLPCITFLGAIYSPSKNTRMILGLVSGFLVAFLWSFILKALLLSGILIWAFCHDRNTNKLNALSIILIFLGSAVMLCLFIRIIKMFFFLGICFLIYRLFIGVRTSTNTNNTKKHSTN